MAERLTMPSTAAADRVGFEIEVFLRPPVYGCRRRGSVERVGGAFTAKILRISMWQPSASALPAPSAVTPHWPRDGSTAGLAEVSDGRASVIPNTRRVGSRALTKKSCWQLAAGSR